jgi:cell division septum initiation protein DivIVA
MNSDRPGDDNQMSEQEAGLHVILDDLAHLVETAKAMPMSSSALVNRPEALALVDELRAALPEQLAHADEVLAEADRVLDDARRQAEDILTTARARAIELVQQEQVVVQAESRAADIIDEAERKATELRVDADDYCDRRLADFEVDLGKILAQVQAGRAKLADRLGSGLVPEWPNTRA